MSLIFSSASTNNGIYGSDYRTVTQSNDMIGLTEELRNELEARKVKGLEVAVRRARDGKEFTMVYNGENWKGNGNETWHSFLGKNAGEYHWSHYKILKEPNIWDTELKPGNIL